MTHGNPVHLVMSAATSQLRSSVVSPSLRGQALCPIGIGLRRCGRPGAFKPPADFVKPKTINFVNINFNCDKQKNSRNRVLINILISLIADKLLPARVRMLCFFLRHRKTWDETALPTMYHSTCLEKNGRSYRFK